jgi:hypothetical protein
MLWPKAEKPESKSAMVLVVWTGSRKNKLRLVGG